METLCSYFECRYVPFADTHPLKEPFLTKGDEQMLLRMERLLSQAKSFALSGESGCGKSMLLMALQNRLDKSRYRCIPLCAGGLKKGALLRELCEHLALSTKGRGSLRSRIHAALTKTGEKDGPYTVFLLDEAHALEEESFLDLISLIHDGALRTSCASLVLCGHPMLRKILGLDIHASTRTRLALHFDLAALTSEEAGNFIAYRLKAAGAKESLFTPDAMQLLALDSKGNRRVLLNLCGNSMDEAVMRKEKIVTADLIRTLDTLT